MPARTQTACLSALIVWLSLGAGLFAATSAEINPFAPTIDQVNARFARIQQEVDRLRAAGMVSAADEMAQSLQHFRDQLAGRAPSLISGPELDVVQFNDPGNVQVNLHPTGRPVVLALRNSETVNWTLNIDPGVQLQRVIVSGHEAALRPAGVPAGVPVDLYAYPAGDENRFSFGDMWSTPPAVKTLQRLTGLTPSSVQRSSSTPATPFSIGAGSTEWAAQRVRYEMQPLYKEATAFQMAQGRAAARQFRFTGLYSEYTPEGFGAGTRVAQMDALGAIDGGIFPAYVNYKSIAVDPRGPTYYGFKGGGAPVRFDPVTRQETPLPALSAGVLGSVSAMTFDTKRNRLVLTNSSGTPSRLGLLLYYPDDNTWLRSAVVNQSHSIIESLTYLPAADAYFALKGFPGSAPSLDRFDPTGLLTGQVELSQFIDCEYGGCRLAPAGDRLVVIASPTLDPAEPLLGPLPHSFLIDPANGNVTILGALPEPGSIIVLFAFGIVTMHRRRY